jgi:hypothetical protein
VWPHVLACAAALEPTTVRVQLCRPRGGGTCGRTSSRWGAAGAFAPTPSPRIVRVYVASESSLLGNQVLLYTHSAEYRDSDCKCLHMLVYRTSQSCSSAQLHAALQCLLAVQDYYILVPDGLM